MGLKFGQNIKFQFFFRFLQHSGRDKAFYRDKACLSRHRSRHTACRDIGHDILLVATTGRDILLVATYFPDSSLFFSPTCRGHNFFVLTRIWACEYSLERSLNVECSHEGIGTI